MTSAKQAALRLTFALALLSGCTTTSETPARTVALLTARPGDSAVRSLSAQLSSLSPNVLPTEADQIAASAYLAAHELTIEYKIVGPALFQNFLINVGVKKRGLCYQWAEDLIARLDALPLTTLELHWGVAHKRGLREHNCVVVTARGQPFAEGVVLDCWRNAGRLYFGPVTGDRYPWREDDWDWRKAIQSPPGALPPGRTDENL